MRPSVDEDAEFVRGRIANVRRVAWARREDRLPLLALAATDASPRPRGRLLSFGVGLFLALVLGVLDT